jgi:hypothetical protein
LRRARLRGLQVRRPWTYLTGTGTLPGRSAKIALWLCMRIRQSCPSSRPAC